MTNNATLSDLGRLTREKVSEVADLLLSEFQSCLGNPPGMEGVEYAEIIDFIERVGVSSLRSPEQRLGALEYSLNVKLKSNEGAIKAFVDKAATYGLFYNYHERLDIAEAFNQSSSVKIDALIDRLEDERARIALKSAFNPLPWDDLMALLEDELSGTLNRRTKEREPHRARDLVLSLLASFIYRCFDERAVHQANDPVPSEEYETDFWLRLTTHREHLYSRDHALSVRVINGDDIDGDPNLTAQMRLWIERQYRELNNHGFVAIIFDNEAARSWRIIEDIMLFSERFQSSDAPPKFFRGKQLWRELSSELSLPDAMEKVAKRIYEGFLFKDCFVIGSDGDERTMLIFQKNVRDQTPLPCPACRSHNTRSNSYPSLGVRSWECASWICPDRSRSNRGKRFAFWSLLCQKGLLDGRNTVPKTHVRAWSRDVIETASLSECLEMLVRHYSLYGDGVSIETRVTSGLDFLSRTAGRDISIVAPSTQIQKDVEPSSIEDFRSLYLYPTTPPAPVVETSRPFYTDGFIDIIHGDAENALRNIPEGSVDGAVTSPPYYNARNYAQWSNIFTHISSMRSIGEGVYRALKPGSYYLYNVFDYFDNDQTIVSSAMGNRRIILSAYTSDAFQNVGFELCGNIAWDKGEIEGKRAFNGGNYSPFYQAPFNCWEHILIFRKPGDGPILEWPRRWRCPPVKKMFGGENKHGHTAPFPDALPSLLVDRLPQGSLVLDPFAGSMTTGRAAKRKGIRSICIERSLEYCRLGVDMLNAETSIIPGLL